MNSEHTDTLNNLDCRCQCRIAALRCHSPKALKKEMTHFRRSAILVSMKITFIRAAKPDFEWAPRCDSAAFNAAAAAYARADILPYEGRSYDTSGRTVYCGTEPRFRQTAEAIFGLSSDMGPASGESGISAVDNAPAVRPSSAPDPSGSIVCTPLLDEIPVQAFSETGRALPLSLWNAMAELQWFTGSPRQPESRSESCEKAARFLDELMQTQKNCIIISDERRIRLLVRELKCRHFRIRQGGFLHIGHLERIVATGNEPHCGGCMHDCPLNNPGCMIGKDKAAKAGIRPRSAAQ